MFDLPEDTLYYNIFTRIPIKSLIRFRCVCKQWCDYIDGYINDPHLANNHHVIKEPKPMLNGLIKSSIPLQELVSVHCFLRITEDTIVRIQVEKDLSSIIQVKRSSIYHPYHKIQGYCNGLIALIKQHNFQNCHNIGTTFVVINPLTKERHELPQLKRPYEIIKGQGLGFDNSTNTFKMVCLFKKNQGLIGRNDIGSVVHVLGTDSWREIPQQVPLLSIDGEAVYANGRLYWRPTYVNLCRSHLVWLDMKKEKFGVIDLPKETEGWYLLRLVDLNGDLGCCLYYPTGPGHEGVKVWILKHEDQWIIHCVYKQPDCSNGQVSVLGCWNQDGDLLISSAGGFPLFFYRLKSGSLHKLIGPEDEAEGEQKAEVRMYQSSFLSIRKWH